MVKKICRNIKDVEEMYNKCKQLTLFAVDTETISLEDKTMIGMSIATNDESWYIPVSILPVITFKKYIKDLLEDNNIKKVFHNAKFDMKVFKKIGIGINKYYDTMIMAYLVDNGKRTYDSVQKFGLKFLAKEVLGVDMIKYKEVSPDDLDRFASYAMDDTIYTLQLFNYYLPKLTPMMIDDLIDIEMPFVEVLAHMEERGIRINVPRMKSLNTKIEKLENTLLAELITETVKNGFIPKVKKVAFNLDSHTQLKQYLGYIGVYIQSTQISELKKHSDNKFVEDVLEYKQNKKSFIGDRLKISLEQKVKKSGFEYTTKSSMKDKVFNPNSHVQVKDFLSHIGIEVESTGAPILEKYVKKNVWIGKLLKYKKLAKLRGSFIVNLLPKIIENNGRLKGSFHQTGTQTGRLSSSKPNHQNFPSHDDFEYKALFIATEGYKMIVADYSQQELRLLAHYSQDKNMLKFFKDGHDLHSATAHSMFHLDCEIGEVKNKYPDYRFKAKSINFGLPYGMSKFALARVLEISPNKAEELMDMYFAQFPSLKGYMAMKRAQAKRIGYSTTLFGRRRYFPKLQHLGQKEGRTIQQDLASVDRESFNNIIQGSGADMLKKALVDLYKVIKERNDGTYIITTVHDEIVIECPENLAEEYKIILQNCMENAVIVSVEMIAEAKICNNWLEGK